VRQFPVVKAAWARDPADPWLIAYAEVYNYTIVSDEIPAAMHNAARKKTGIYIPDMCAGRLPPVPFMSLRDLADELGWL